MPPESLGPRPGGVDVTQLSRNRRARVAVAALFLTNGAVFANLVPRLPELKTELGLTNAEYGVVVAAFPAGALVAGLGAAQLIRRFTSARVAVAGTVGIAALVLVAGASSTPAVVATALFLGGSCDALVDVAQNTHGLRVQRAYGRSIINSLHAVWSAGAVLGGLMAAATLALHVSRTTHLAGSAVIFSVVALGAAPFLLRGPDREPDAGPVTSAGRPGRAVYVALAAFVVIATAGAVVEDAGSSWATLYLRDSLGAVGATAAFGYIALLGFQFIGRLVGDRLVDRFGERAVARYGGLMTSAGMGFALLVPSVPATIAGFAVAGIGIATVVPAAMHAADQLPGLRPGTGLTVVAWLMRVGFVCSPLIVGLIADVTSLRVGLLVVPAAGLAVIAASGALSARRPQTRS
jgi:MFS family permease